MCSSMSRGDDVGRLVRDEVPHPGHDLEAERARDEVGRPARGARAHRVVAVAPQVECRHADRPDLDARQRPHRSIPGQRRLQGGGRAQDREVVLDGRHRHAAVGQRSPEPLGAIVQQAGRRCRDRGTRGDAASDGAARRRPVERPAEMPRGAVGTAPRATRRGRGGARRRARPLARPSRVRRRESAPAPVGPSPPPGRARRRRADRRHRPRDRQPGRGARRASSRAGRARGPGIRRRPVPGPAAATSGGSGETRAARPPAGRRPGPPPPR